jgi:S1-C subfamily serine protease
LVDLDGKVVGVNTLINRMNSSLGFAIPSKLAQVVSQQLIAQGRVVRPWLGIRIETLADQPALQKVLGLDNGVVVREIFADTPAARSELQPADVVVDVDGDPVASARDLQRSILNKGIGATVKLKVWRRQDGDYRTVSVQAEELPAAPETKQAAGRPQPFRPPAPGSDGSEDPFAVFGLQVQDLPDEVAAEMSLPAGGVIVTHVEPGGPAALAGLERRDVITAVGEDAVGNNEGLAAALGKLAEGDGAVLLVERQGKETYAILKK